MTKRLTNKEKLDIPVFDNRLCRFFFSKDGWSIIRVGKNLADSFVMQTFGGYIDNEFTMMKSGEPYIASLDNLNRLFKFSNIYEIPEPLAKELVKSNTKPEFDKIGHLAVRVLKY